MTYKSWLALPFWRFILKLLAVRLFSVFVADVDNGTVFIQPWVVPEFPETAPILDTVNSFNDEIVNWWS